MIRKLFRKIYKIRYRVCTQCDDLMMYDGPVDGLLSLYEYYFLFGIVVHKRLQGYDLARVAMENRAFVTHYVKYDKDGWVDDKAYAYGIIHERRQIDARMRARSVLHTSFAQHITSFSMPLSGIVNVQPMNGPSGHVFHIPLVTAPMAKK
jgi:hypothetical protein